MEDPFGRDIISSLAPSLQPEGLEDFSNAYAGLEQQTAMAEIMEQWNTMQDILREFRRAEIIDANGKAYEILARELGDSLTTPYYAFQLVPDGDAIRITPGVIGGNLETDGTEAIPEVNGTSLFADPAPTITLTSSLTQYVYAKVEIVPESSLTAGSTAYYITGGSRTGEWEFDTYSTPPTGQLPEINTSTGAVTQNGIYYRLLGTVKLVDGAATVTNQVRVGPWGALFCASSLALTIDEPFRFSSATIVVEES